MDQILVSINMFFGQNLKKRFQEREKRRGWEEKREKTTDCKVLGVTTLLQNTENTISSSALKTLQKYQLSGCPGTASLALVELMPITQRKMNCTEQTVED